jgi:2-keto-4-pentenoate hydratase
MTETLPISNADVATRLRNAYRTGAVPPLRDALASGDTEGAYRVQAINTQYWMDAGRQIAGMKIGLTATSVQAQLGVSQPDYGVLFHDMLIEDGSELPFTRVLQPKVEAEVAILLERDIANEHASVRDILTAAAYAVPAIEIVDSRIENWKISIADTIADNASSAYFVLGHRPQSICGLDLKTCGMVLEIDGAISSMGVGAACLGHPLVAAAWLVRTLSRRGIVLKAGEVLLTGALGPMVSLRPGTRVSATIGGLGTVSFSARGEHQ